MNKLDNKLMTSLLFAPQIIMIGILIYGIIAGMIQSFGIIPALNMTTLTFDYYLKIFNNPNFIASLLFTLRIAFISAFFSVSIGLFIIYIIVNSHISKKLIHYLLQIPIIIPYVIVALFTMLFFSKSGLFARIFASFDYSIDFFNSVLFTSNGLGIILSYLWKGVPFIIFYSLDLIFQINTTYGEAGLTLGASKPYVFLKIVLPLCRETIYAGFLILFMYAFGSYELPKLLGPTLPKSISELAYIEYTHPDMHNRPYAMAINGVILIICIVAAIIYYRFVNSKQRIKGASHEKSSR